jgi:uncharacterized protein (TIGR02058 family)
VALEPVRGDFPQSKRQEAVCFILMTLGTSFWSLLLLSLTSLLVDFSFSFTLETSIRAPHCCLSRTTTLAMSTTASDNAFINNVLFVECGFGNDSHGQSATKAAVRACRNAIEFNSIPSIAKLVPGGYNGLKISVILGVPDEYVSGLDVSEVEKVFPYGKVEFKVQSGGLVAPSGIAIESLGDANDDMVIVCAAVTVGY